MFSKVGIGNNKFPRELLFEILDIIQDIFNRKIECCLGIGNLYQLMTNQDSLVKRCISLVHRLLEVLPHFTLPEEIKERNLCARYLLPVFQALFDDLNKENPIMFKFVDELNNECQASDINLSRRRSGDWIVLNASGQKKSPGFVEVKRLDFAQIHFKTNMDPVRLGTFSENALDTHDGQNVLAIQTVGTNVTVAQRM